MKMNSLISRVKKWIKTNITGEVIEAKDYKRSAEKEWHKTSAEYETSAEVIAKIKNVNKIYNAHMYRAKDSKEFFAELALYKQEEIDKIIKEAIDKINEEESSKALKFKNVSLPFPNRDIDPPPTSLTGSLLDIDIPPTSLTGSLLDIEAHQRGHQRAYRGRERKRSY
jgi:DNA-binding Lrp family transcriptional regulator